jgi:hypothetical protein
MKGGVHLRRAVFGLGAALLCALAVPALRAEDAPKSGFQVNDRTPPFDVVDVSGPNKGKQLCYV